MIQKDTIQSRICILPDCNNSRIHKDYCPTHYHRLRRNGDLTTVQRIYRSGLSNHNLYNTYFNMIQRCYNTKRKSYKDYGGRGITVCNRWLGAFGFQNFIEDMGDKPFGLTLDRIDNNGNYESDNCKWSTRSEQNINRRKFKHGLSYKAH